jgi:MFS family permease
MVWLLGDIRTVMWIAAVPACIAVTILIVYVREPERPSEGGFAKKTLTFADAKRLPPRYWFVVLLGAVFTLARFSEAFLILRAQSVGLEISHVPLVLVVMNFFYAAAAFPAGAAADRVNRRALHMAFTQGLLSKLVADTAPKELLGTGFGVFNVVGGGMLLLASVIAGLLWSTLGPTATFLAGGLFAALAATGLLASNRAPQAAQ